MEKQKAKEEEKESEKEEVEEEPKKKTPEKQGETKQKLIEIAKDTASVVKTGVVALVKLVIVIVLSFLKALTINFYNNIKENWGKIYRKSSEKKVEVKKK